MRYFTLLAGTVMASLTQIVPASAFASTSSHCEVPDLGRFDTPAIESLFQHKGSPMWQAENRACTLYDWGLIYQLIGDYKNAITAYTYAVGWMSNFGEAYAARGDAYEALGDHDKAKADYLLAWQLDQNNATALNSICWERAKRGYPLDLALGACDGSVKLDPSQWSSWDSRCLVNYRLGNYAAAISDCDEALKQWDDETWDIKNSWFLRSRTQYVRGLAKIKNGQADNGNADIAAAKDAYPDVDKKYASFGVTK